MFRILVMGGLGFIGSSLLNMLGANPLFQSGRMQVFNLDKLTYAANPDNLMDAVRFASNYQLIVGDIANRDHVFETFAKVRPTHVLHLAAESHVDNSIQDATPFVRTNVLGTQNLLDAAMAFEVERFVHVSTDEVYGSLGLDDPAFTETTPLSPRSPYSASKASSDMLALAYHETHGLPVVVTRCSNNYGPNQHVEKLIPKTIARALRGEPVPVYGTGENVRDWIHVFDHCRGIVAAMTLGRSGEVYNFGGSQELSNLDLVRSILEATGRNQDLIQFVEDRKGHDFRYAIDWRKSYKDLGWKPMRCLEDDLFELVRHYDK